MRFSIEFSLFGNGDDKREEDDIWSTLLGLVPAALAFLAAREPAPTRAPIPRQGCCPGPSPRPWDGGGFVRPVSPFGFGMPFPGMPQPGESAIFDRAAAEVADCPCSVCTMARKAVGLASRTLVPQGSAVDTVPGTSVACPKCGAEPFNACRDVDKYPLAVSHIERLKVSPLGAVKPD